MSINSAHATIVTHKTEKGVYSFIMPLGATIDEAMSANAAFSAALYSTKQSQLKESTTESKQEEIEDAELHQES